MNENDAMKRCAADTGDAPPLPKRRAAPVNARLAATSRAARPATDTATVRSAIALVLSVLIGLALRRAGLELPLDAIAATAAIIAGLLVYFARRAAGDLGRSNAELAGLLAEALAALQKRKDK
jgi:hypothetical protein